MTQARVDINCDIGESYGVWRLGDDQALLPHISSASIACGFHAGDPSVMRTTLRAAAAAGLAVGAHTGLPDREGFGRRRMSVTAEEVYDMIVYQIGALSAFADCAGTRLAHVKPHGALYNMAAADASTAAAVAAAVRDVDPSLLLYGLAGSVSLTEGARAGLHTVAEAFADRAYERDGQLSPRGTPDAVLVDPVAAAQRAVRMITKGVVETRDGGELRIHADTLCIHGDGTHAAGLARELRGALAAAGVLIAAPVRT